MFMKMAERYNLYSISKIEKGIVLNYKDLDEEIYFNSDACFS